MFGNRVKKITHTKEQHGEVECYGIKEWMNKWKKNRL